MNLDLIELGRASEETKQLVDSGNPDTFEEPKEQIV